MLDKSHFLSRQRAGRRCGAVASLVVLSLLTAPSGMLAEEQGEPLAVDFKAMDLEGRPFNGLDLKGKIVLLDFWAVWCAPCVEAIPKLNKLKRELADDDFQIVSIASYSGTGGDVKEFLEDHPAEYTMVVGDEDLIYRYGVIGYPTYFLIDPVGNIHQKYVGALPGLAERIKSDVEGLKTKFGMH